MAEYRFNTQKTSGEVVDIAAIVAGIPGYEVFPNFNEVTWDVFKEGKREPGYKMISVELESKRIRTHNGFSLRTEQIDRIRKLLISA